MLPRSRIPHPTGVGSLPSARRWLGTLGLFVGACGPPELGTRHTAVTNGAPDPGDPGVVAIAEHRGTAVFCTGTLIAPSVVLTAAHCPPDGASFRSYAALVGTAAGEGTLTRFVGARRHPSYDPETMQNDLTVAYLAEPATAPPWPLRLEALDASVIGHDARIVGFGATSGAWDDAGRKRQGTARVESYDAASLRLVPGPSQPCVRDSGGPVFLTTDGIERLAAVVSRGDASCSEYSVATRVDAHLDGFLAEALAFAADGAAAVGAVCLSDAHCSSGRCLSAADDPRVRYCTAACGGGSACPAGMRCDSSRLCVHPLPTPSAIDSSCGADADCVDGECRDGACVRRCVPKRGGCPPGYACQNAGGINFFCAPAPPEGCQHAPGRARPPGLSGLLELAMLVAALRARVRRDPG